MGNRSKHPKLSGTEGLITEFYPVIRSMEKDKTITRIRPDKRRLTENGHTDPVSIVRSDGQLVKLRFSAPNCHQDIFIITGDPKGFKAKVPGFNQLMAEKFERKTSPRT